MQKNQKRFLVLNITLSVVFLALFLCVMFLVLSGYVFKIDSFNFIILNLRTPFWNTFFKHYTFIGNFYFLCSVCVILFCILFFKLKAKKLAISMISCFTIASLLNVVRRARPADVMLVKELGFSFPSWHAMMTTVMLGLFIFVVFKIFKSKVFKAVVAVFLSLDILLVGFSRVYLGVHYVSDVIAGLLIGLFILATFNLIYNYKIKK